MRRAALLAILLSSSAAQASASADLHYTQDEVFSSAVRFVRIDRGCKITDRDDKTAFVTFECQGDDGARHGAVEMFATPKAGRHGVRVKITLNDDPHYEELRWLDLLERKLRDELGAPEAPPPPASPAPAAPSKAKPKPDQGSAIRTIDPFGS